MIFHTHKHQFPTRSVMTVATVITSLWLPLNQDHIWFLTRIFIIIFLWWLLLAFSCRIWRLGRCSRCFLQATANKYIQFILSELVAERILTKQPKNTKQF